MTVSRNKTYICIDLKSFFASVECVLRGLDPMSTRLVVADASRTDKTICLAVSPALKAFGVPGRPRLFEVKKIVGDYERSNNTKIDYIVAAPQMAKYVDFSVNIFKIYLRYIAPDDIHVYSIDEVFIDATDYLKLYDMTAHELCMFMIKDVLKETGITATAGIGSNLYVAKIAMDIVAKHAEADEDGVRTAELDEMSYRKLLWGHTPITDFWRMGKGTAKKLAKWGIYTMGDLARASLHSEEQLYEQFGIDAEILIDHAWGYEPCTMDMIKSYKTTARSISSGQVLSCPYDYEKAKLIVKEMTDLLVLDLVSKNLVCESVTLEVGYDRENVDKGGYKGTTVVDYYGRTIPKAAHGTTKFAQATSSTNTIMTKVVELYDRIVNPTLTVRRVTISANNVYDEADVTGQLSFFTDYDALEKEKKLQKAMLSIKGKYGSNAILKGMNLLEGGTARDRNNQIGGHKG